MICAARRARRQSTRRRARRSRRARPGWIGRPLLARALVRAGHVRTTREAFDLYLGEGRRRVGAAAAPAPEEVIGLIQRRGRHRVACPPGRCSRHDEWIPAMAAAGLDALEVYYIEHPPEIDRTTASWRAARPRHERWLRLPRRRPHGPQRPGASCCRLKPSSDLRNGGIRRGRNVRSTPHDTDHHDRKPAMRSTTGCPAIPRGRRCACRLPAAAARWATASRRRPAGARPGEQVMCRRRPDDLRRLQGRRPISTAPASKSATPTKTSSSSTSTALSAGSASPGDIAGREARREPAGHGRRQRVSRMAPP